MMMMEDGLAEEASESCVKGEISRMIATTPHSRSDLTETDALPHGNRYQGNNNNNYNNFEYDVFSRPQAVMPVERNSEQYNMNHERRGVAVIFNHYSFDPYLGLSCRNGTSSDRERLKNTFLKLEFDVRVYDDLTDKSVGRVLEDLSNEDHDDADCLLICVLSHGGSHGIYARDHMYKPDRLWLPFQAGNCRSLAGKPKIFLIQACRGEQLDGGIRLVSLNKTETDSASTSYCVPQFADFVMGYSTMFGYYSFRNSSEGSWFVQAICKVLNQNYEHDDLLSMLTKINRMVALDFESNSSHVDFNGKKQIPIISSLLTRKVFLFKKLKVPVESKTVAV